MSESVTRTNLQPAGCPPDSNQSLGYSHGVRSGQTIWVSGQVAKNPQGDIVGTADIEAQIVQVMENIKAVLADGSAVLDDVVKTVVFITDPAFREPYQRLRRRYFRAPNFPASSLVVVSALIHPALLIEVEAVAVIGSGRPVAA